MELKEGPLPYPHPTLTPAPSEGWSWTPEEGEVLSTQGRVLQG